ncbi:hypothetical protein Glove_185g89 [Diversispora epigaea]|uniref:CCHC-type domain-containing protein n=1 Tax=Diversispora epigaea TaxID=1348612 RepID=A0A397IMA0_9GLOM|nr:hypothetical protein Glove_185g89 [Diversispora epigaea]
MSSMAPLLAQILQYIGQEPPDDYINKVIQVFSYGTSLGVGAFNDGVKANVLKSKMSGKYAPVPAQYPAGTNIDTPARFRAWLRHRYHELTLRTKQASLTKLTQEKFLSTDIPKTYEERIQLLLLQTPNDNDDALAILWNHLPDELFSRMEITAPADIDAFFTNLKNIWLKRQPSIFTSLDYLDTVAERLGYSDYGSRNPDALIKFIDDELYNRLGYENYHLRREPFGQVKKVNIRVITRANTSDAKKVYATKKPLKKPAKKPTKVTYKCSNCGKIGHRKNMCLEGTKPKKVNYTYQSEPENSDDEEVVILEDDKGEFKKEEEEEITSDNEPQSCFNEILIEARVFLNNLFIKMKDQFDSYYGEKYTVKEKNKIWENIAKKYLTIFQPFIEFLNRQSSNSSSYKNTNQNYDFIPYSNIPENTELRSLNYAIKVYQGAQITRNWPNPFKLDFLKIEPNDVATILCRIGDLIIAHVILDTGADSSMFTDNIPEHLGIKIDKKNVHKLTGAVGDSQSIGTSYNVPITIGNGENSITVYEDISVIPTKKDQDENDISIMILGTKWQHRAGWDPIVKSEFVATHNGKTITILLSTRKEKYSHKPLGDSLNHVTTSNNVFNTEEQKKN